MPSRRSVLQTGAAVGAASIAGCVTGGSRLSLTAIVPDPGTWPLANYGPANTAYNPHATPPRSEVTIYRKQPTDTPAETILHTGKYVVVAGEDGHVIFHAGGSNADAGDELGNFKWSDTLAVDAIATRGQTLYTATDIGQRNESPQENAGVGLLREVGIKNRTLQYAQTFDGGGASIAQLLPTDQTLFVGHADTDHNAVTLSRTAGTSVSTTVGGATVGITDGTLYTSDIATLSAYELSSNFLGQRSLETLWDGYLRDDWRRGRPPTVIDDIVFAGTWLDPSMEEWGVALHDRKTGDLVRKVSVGPAAQATTAATDGRGFIATRVYYETGRLVAIDTQKHRKSWTVDLDHWPLAVAGGGNVVLSAGGTGSRPDPYSSPGRLTAFDAASGDRLWRFETESAISSLALVGSNVFAGTRGGNLFILE